MDATGVGDPVFDDLKRVCPDVEGFKLTQGSKVDLIQRLVVAIEQSKVSWPCGSHMPQSGMVGSMCSDGGAGGDWAVLTNEMKRYEYVISPTGAISYNAPSGYHDDCVIALALANHGRWESEHVGRMFTIDGSRKMRSAIGRRQARVLVG